MKDLIKRNLSGRKVLLFFLLANVVYAIMIFYSIPKLEAYSGGLKILDMRPSGYDVPYVRSLFAALGEEGRNLYLTLQIPLDLLYPGLFGISYALLLGYFLKKLGKQETNYFYLVFLPLAAGFFDYLENFGIINLLRNYPEISTSVVNITSIFTVIKSVLSTIFFITLIITILAYLGRLVFKKQKISTKY